MSADERTQRAVTVARMYYQTGHSTGEIARHLNVSRSTVSRLLTHARESGIVEITVRSDLDGVSRLKADLASHVPSADFHVVDVRDSLSTDRIASAVAQYAAHVVAEVVTPGSRVGPAWGNTVSNVVSHLQPRPTKDVSVVQLNGAGSPREPAVTYAADIVTRFAEAFAASEYLFPVPAFFDHAETKATLWRERSIRHISPKRTAVTLWTAHMRARRVRGSRQILPVYPEQSRAASPAEGDK